MESHLIDAVDQLSPMFAELNSAVLIGIISRVLHILSAIILVGGMFYIRSVLAPSGAEACFAGRRQVWAKWVGISTAFLLLSGVYNIILVFKQAKVDGIDIPMAYHILLTVKLLLALLVMFISAILAGKTEAAERFRGNMRKWLNIGWLAAMAIVVVAAVMRTMH